MIDLSLGQLENIHRALSGGEIIWFNTEKTLYSVYLCGRSRLKQKCFEHYFYRTQVTTYLCWESLHRGRLPWQVRVGGSTNTNMTETTTSGAVTTLSSFLWAPTDWICLSVSLQRGARILLVLPTSRRPMAALLRAEEAGPRLSERCDWLCVRRQKTLVWLSPFFGRLNALCLLLLRGSVDLSAASGAPSGFTYRQLKLWLLRRATKVSACVSVQA